MPRPSRGRSRLSPEQRALIEDRLRIQSVGSIPRRPDRIRAPLSTAQHQLWVLDRMEPDSPLYNVPRAVRLSGRLDLRSLHVALDRLVARHEGLRARVRGSLSEPRIEVARVRRPALPVVDLQELPRSRRVREAERLTTFEAERAFDLTRGPLVRFGLIRSDPRNHVFTVTLHHLVADARSLEILFSELGHLYDGSSAQLAPRSVDYGDFAAWQAGRSPEDPARQGLVWWTERLAGPLPDTQLPFDRPRPRSADRRGALVDRISSAALRDGVLRLARDAETTPFVVIAAALAAVLGYYGSQDEVCLGTVLGNRSRAELDDVVGYFVNPVVLRCSLSGRPSGADLVRRIRQVTLEAMDHGEVPFELLVQELAPDREAGRNPLFQVMLVYQSTPPVVPRLGGLDATLVESPRTTAKFDLSVECWEEPAGLRIRLEYPLALFDRCSVQRIGRHLETLLGGLVDDPGRPVTDLPILPPAERHAVRVEWGGRTSRYPSDGTVEALFRTVVEGGPDRIALVDGERHLSYAALQRRVDGQAARLAARGVGPEVPVGVCLGRSAELAVSILAVLEAGGCFVPLDPAYPKTRHELVIRDAGLPLVIAGAQEAANLPDGSVTLLAPRVGKRSDDQPPRAPVHPDRLAYVMYTSGSTGLPKGVAVAHRSIVRLVRGSGFVRFDREECFLCFAPTAFDASTLEIWGPLLNGGRLEIHPQGPASLGELTRFAERRRVTTLWLTAALFGRLAADDLKRLGGLRHLLAGGDVLPADQVRTVLRLLPDTRLVNGYGPTENTTFTCCHLMAGPADAPAPGARVPVGRPIANGHVQVLDDHLRQVPIGLPGELYAGGAGLARGYLGRPGWTAERFVPDPHASEAGARAYRTGDLVRWLQDGTVDFLGRTDDQVKVRGHRVEPGEVEAVVRDLPEVAEATVVAREAQGERSLVVYVVPRGETLDGAQVVDRLRGILPEPLVPSAAVVLPALPLNAHGKLDRAALPDPGLPQAPSSAEPAGPIERVIADLWVDLLQVGKVGRDDDFFTLGGHSVRAMELAEALREVFEVSLPLAAIFEHPTVAGLAGLLTADPDRLPRIERSAELMLRIGELSEEEVDRLLDSGGATEERQ